MVTGWSFKMFGIFTWIRKSKMTTIAVLSVFNIEF